MLRRPVFISGIKYGLFDRIFKAYVLILLMMVPAFADSQYKILAYGDSLTAGYGLDAADAYPAKLAEMIKANGINIEMINAGVSGETTQGGLNRLNWTLKHNPDLVLLGLGANDALRFLSPALAKDNLSQMIETLQAKDIDVILLGMKAPRNQGGDYTEKFDQVFPDLAAKYGLALYPFLLEDVFGRADLNIADGLHPNAKGTHIMAKNIMPYVLKHLENKTKIME